MNDTPNVADTADHLSDFALDRLVACRSAGLEPSPPDRGHLDRCASCAGRYRDFTQAAADFKERAARRGLALMGKRGSSARRGWTGGLVLGMAACLAVVVWGTRQEPVGGLRAKGNLALEVWVARTTGQVESLLSGARVAPGDRIRFGVSTAAAGYLAVVSIDGGRHVSLYFPVSAPSLPPVTPGHQLLPGAIELDDVPGRERLIAVRCARPLTRDEILVAIRAAIEQSGGDSTTVQLSGPIRDCTQSSFWLLKGGVQ